MKSESLKQILAFLTRILEKNDFNEDKQIIQYLFKELEKLEHQLPTDNKLEELQRIIIDLEIKYGPISLSSGILIRESFSFNFLLN